MWFCKYEEKSFCTPVLSLFKKRKKRLNYWRHQKLQSPWPKRFKDNEINFEEKILVTISPFRLSHTHTSSFAWSHDETKIREFYFELSSKWCGNLQNNPGLRELLQMKHPKMQQPFQIWSQRKESPKTTHSSVNRVV